jgi:glycosyltransferase involved in cell wall biosynthesis
MLAPPEIELSIVMPCLNEAATLPTCIGEAQRAAAQAGIAAEVLIADNGSTDGSQAIAERLGARVVTIEAKGYGNALRGGIEAARGRYVIMGDADASYDFSHLPRFVERLRSGDDLVMGNRFRGGIQAGAMPWKNRYVGNPLLSGIGRLFFRTPIGDFHCGLRGFPVAAYRRMDLRTTGMEFASEMVIKAMLLGLRVSEVPTTLRPDGRGRPPHLRPWRDGWRHLRFMLLYSPRWVFLYPGAGLALAGLAGFLFLIPGARRVGSVALDLNTLVFSLAAIQIGIQAIAFAIGAKAFAIQSGLRPRDQKLHRLIQAISLEAGLVGGALLAVTGLVLSVGAVWYWRSRGFGDLDPEIGLRRVIPGVACLSVGCQVILNSFFLSIFRVRFAHR